MRVFIILIFISTLSKVFGQSDLTVLLKNIQTINLPFTTEQGKNKEREKKKILESSDSLFIMEKLNNKLPKKINPYGNSPFGQIDCQDASNCDKLENLKEISILWFLKVSENNFLLYLEFEKDGQFGLVFGALLSMNENGELVDWFFSDGSVNSGNPNGNVSRDFTIQKDTTILIEEASWGNNTISYSFKSNHKIIMNAGDNFDQKYSIGKFDLRSLSIKY
jgi:hypothetical protein